MNTDTLAHNPFMLMVNPEVVLAAMERSDNLGRLNRRMCHPLDQIPLLRQDDAERAERCDEDCARVHRRTS